MNGIIVIVDSTVLRCKMKTVYYKPKPPKEASLIIIEGTIVTQTITLHGSMSFGRDYPEVTSDIRVKSRIVGRNHGEFFYEPSDGSYYYMDKNSTNGSYINGIKLEPFNERGTRAVKLNDGDVIRVDRSTLTDPHPEAVIIIFSTSISPDSKWSAYKLNSANISIGRDAGNDFVIDDLMVSSRHAHLSYQNDRWYIADDNSTNGVLVNGSEISETTVLNKYDVIRICDTVMVFLGDSFVFNSMNSTNCTLSVEIKRRVVNFGRKTLLKDISAEFSGGDFVLILGGSGAGKTTLIRSILGEDRADGRIILDGIDLYKNFKSVKSRIGMVPQYITLRKNDTLQDTLMDTAAMKLGGKYSKAELEKRVDDVLNHVGITEHRHKLIGQLSGGQQKKAAVANQLVGFQKVFICDEPDSGLDAASRMQQMEILSEIADENKIVMVITHQPDDAVRVENGERRTLFTKVIVIARSSVDGAGHMAYFGSIEDAFSYFGVTRLQDIMLEINPASEGGRGNADKFIEKYSSLRKDK